MDRLERWDFDR